MIQANTPIAVIVSTYNAPQMLHRVLTAYTRQNDLNFSIYIADDGSDTKTRIMIQSFKDASAIHIEHVWHKDQGFRKARIHNLVLKQVDEAYILFTDGDCIPLPNMIATHKRLAEEGTCISGSRILLSKEVTQQLINNIQLEMPTTVWQWMRWRMQGHINRCSPLWWSAHCTSPHQELAGIRGCHLSCWREDLCRINGFDEIFKGWGREDSDLVARLFHAGVMRRNLRGMPVLHLWHDECARHQLEENDRLLTACLHERRVRAIEGMAEL